MSLSHLVHLIFFGLFSCYLNLLCLCLFFFLFHIQYYGQYCRNRTRSYLCKIACAQQFPPRGWPHLKQLCAVLDCKWCQIWKCSNWCFQTQRVRLGTPERENKGWKTRHSFSLLYRFIGLRHEITEICSINRKHHSNWTVTLINQSAISRAVNDAKLCLFTINLLIYGVSSAIRFTLWAVKVWTEANVYLENRILFLWFATFHEKNASCFASLRLVVFMRWWMITLLCVIQQFTRPGVWAVKKNYHTFLGWIKSLNFLFITNVLVMVKYIRNNFTNNIWWCHYDVIILKFNTLSPTD